MHVYQLLRLEKRTRTKSLRLKVLLLKFMPNISPNAFFTATSHLFAVKKMGMQRDWIVQMSHSTCSDGIVVAPFSKKKKNEKENEKKCLL